MIKIIIIIIIIISAYPQRFLPRIMRRQVNGAREIHFQVRQQRGE